MSQARSARSFFKPMSRRKSASNSSTRELTAQERKDAEHKLGALHRRVENYERREATLQRQVAEAEAQVRAELNKAESDKALIGVPIDGESEVWMKALGNLRGEIDSAFDKSHARTTEILSEQEKDLLRAFRARLFDRKQELAMLRSIRDEKAASWISRVRQLESDYDYAKEASETLQRNSSTLMARNRELKKKNSEGARERKSLIDQLVLSKRARKVLKEELSRITEEYETVVATEVAPAATVPSWVTVSSLMLPKNGLSDGSPIFATMCAGALILLLL